MANMHLSARKVSQETLSGTILILALALSALMVAHTMFGLLWLALAIVSFLGILGGVTLALLTWL